MHFPFKVTCERCLHFSHFNTALALVTTALTSRILIISLAYSKKPWAWHTKQASNRKYDHIRCQAKCILAALSVHRAKTLLELISFISDLIISIRTSVTLSLAVSCPKVDRSAVVDSHRSEPFLLCWSNCQTAWQLCWLLQLH